MIQAVFTSCVRWYIKVCCPERAVKIKNTRILLFVLIVSLIGAIPATAQTDSIQDLQQAWKNRDAIQLESLLEQADPKALGSEAPQILDWAVANGQTKLVRLLLEKGLDPNVQDQAKDSPLHLAARSGNLALVELLLAHEANPNLTNNFWETPLNDAVASGQEKIIDFLLDKGANVDLVNHKGQTPLSQAYRKQLLAPFLRHHINLEIINRQGETLLLEAANAGDIATVKKLIELGADINAVSALQVSFLMAAMKIQDQTLIEDLLNKEVDIYYKDRSGATALDAACAEGNQTAVMALLQRLGGIESLTPEMRLRLLEKTVASGNLTLLKSLLDLGLVLPEPIQMNQSDQNLILIAAGSKNPHISEMLNFLLAQGFSLETRASDGGTGLMAAGAAANPDGVAFFLDHKVEINARNTQGETALFKVAMTGDLTLFKTLLAHGADLQVKSNDESNLLMAAARAPRAEILAYLFSQNFDVNAQRKNGDTALTHAWLMDNMKLLLGHGANPNLGNMNGINPIRSAIESGDLAKLQLLREHGADIKRSLAADQDLASLAAANGTVELIQFLKAEGLDFWNKQRWVPFQEAYLTANLPVMRLLLEWLPDQNARKTEASKVLGRTSNNVRPDALQFLLSYGIEVPKESVFNYDIFRNMTSPQVLDFLLKLGIDPNVQGQGDSIRARFDFSASYRFTPLQWACWENDLAKVRVLLTHGADPNFTGPNDETPLMGASRSGNINIVKLLISKGAQINTSGPKGETALSVALETNHPVIARFLIEQGATTEGLNQAGDSFLLQAVALGDTGLVQALLESHVEINFISRAQTTALGNAIKKGRPDLVQLLLQYGADPNLALQGMPWNTPLFHATAAGELASVKILLEKGAKPELSEQNGYPLILEAARSGKLELVQFLEKQGFSLDSKDKAGKTALFYALDSENPKLLEYLLKAGLEVNVATDGPLGVTPLMQAVLNKRPFASRFLLEHGADLDYVNSYGQNALTQAVQDLNHTEILELLLTHEKDPERLLLAQQNILKAALRQGNPAWTRRSLAGGLSPAFMAQMGPELAESAVNSHKLELLQLLDQTGLDWKAAVVAGRPLLNEAIYWARANNDFPLAVELVRFLLAKGLDPNLFPPSSESPLAAAVSTRNLAMIALLLDKGADVNASNHFGQTALRQTLINDSENQLEIIKLLLDHGATLSYKNQQEETALSYLLTSMRGLFEYNPNPPKIQAVQYLLEQAEKAHVPMAQQSGILVKAARIGNKDIIELLLKYGAKPEDRDAFGNNALLQALALRPDDSYLASMTRGGDALVTFKQQTLAYFQYLIDKGFDLHAINNKGNNAVLQAAQSGSIDTVKFLQQRGFKLDIRNLEGENPLMLAVRGNNLEIVRYLLDQGLDFKAKNNKGETALMLATQVGNKELFQLLQPRGADLNAVNEKGENALILAIRQGNLGLIANLIQLGIDPNVQTHSGSTALMQAILLGHAPTVEALLIAKANPNLKDSQGNSPLFLAITSGQPEMIQLLHRYQVDMKVSGPTGESPLESAIALGKIDIVQTLLTKGCDPKVKNNLGETLLMGSFPNGLSQAMLYLLLDLGIDINAQASDGSTALIRAVQKYHMYSTDNRSNSQAIMRNSILAKDDFIRLLLSHEANILLKDNANKTALDYASLKNESNIVQILQEALKKSSGKN